ncbi:hypothetical protein PRZ48_008632 [Zasmidium cellare]|uniref:Ubiquitin-like domain-containing protein n=1 Tax=Zasmidium cellare TaxID=395010 RepID=A0ABR0EH39_ZASCE|nr:hypothetical protein PRZ48_008632 [Zasmidium cellare]
MSPCPDEDKGCFVTVACCVPMYLAHLLKTRGTPALPFQCVQPLAVRTLIAVEYAVERLGEINRKEKIMLEQKVLPPGLPLALYYDYIYGTRIKVRVPFELILCMRRGDFFDLLAHERDPLIVRTLVAIADGVAKTLPATQMSARTLSWDKEGSELLGLCKSIAVDEQLVRGSNNAARNSDPVVPGGHEVTNRPLYPIPHEAGRAYHAFTIRIAQHHSPEIAKAIHTLYKDMPMGSIVLTLSRNGLKYYVWDVTFEGKIERFKTLRDTMAPNIKAEPSEAISVMLPAEVVAKSKNGGLGVLLPPSIDPAIAAAVRAVDYAVLASANNDQVAKDKIPFQLEIKSFWIFEKGKQFVQVCGLSTLMELARAIECELHFSAHDRRLVVMGKTLYNHDYPDGNVNAGKTLSLLGITDRHIVWVKEADPQVKVDT